jgi:hypothetical protein
MICMEAPVATNKGGINKSEANALQLRTPPPLLNMPLSIAATTGIPSQNSANLYRYSYLA